jgi:preprotein translocase subunit SecF
MMNIQKNSFSFVKNFNKFAILSLLLCAVGLVGLALLPFGVTWFNLDIDFMGGTTITFNIHRQTTNEELDNVRSLITSTLGTAPSAVQRVGTEGTFVSIKTLNLSPEQRVAVFNAMQTRYGSAAADRNVEDVDPTVGRDLQRSAVIAASVALLLMLCYIAIRFTFSSGVATIIGLLHDLLIMLGVYVVFQVSMNMNFIAAMLTVLGYSINATIIAFDRVRENQRLMQKASFEDVVDASIWQTLARNINTTATTLLPIAMILVLGVPAIRNFLMPVTVGLLSGAYSSVFVVGPVWSKLRKKAA